MSEVDLTFLNELEILNIYDTPLVSLDVSNLSNLTRLDLGSFDPIESLNLTGLNNLEYLRTYFSYDTDSSFNLNLSDLDNVITLLLGHSAIENIDLSGLTELRFLDVSNNSIENLNLQDNTNLEIVNIYDNPLDSLDISSNPEIHQLSLSSLPVMTYANLKNGNNENLGNNSLFGGILFEDMPNLEKVCVDNADTFTSTLYDEPVLGSFDFIVTDDCATLAIEEKQMTNLQVYPNPTSGKLKITGNINPVSVEVFDLTGKKVMNLKNTKSLNLQNLSAGCFFIKITDQEGNNQVKRVIKK